MKATARLRRFLAGAAQIALLLGAAALVFLFSAYLAMRQQVFGTEVEVPRVLAMEAEPARRGLEARDLVLETTGSRHDPRVPAGRILSQDPPAGSKLKPGRKVKVLVSLGPEEFRVPEVTGMPVARARVLLGQGRLRIGVIAFVHSRGAEENLIVSQDPPAGSPVERDGRVDLLVSRGVPPAPWVMPDLAGRTVAEARALLQRHGLQVEGVRDEPGAPASRVVRQSPLPGYPVTRDDLISLWAKP